MSNYGYAISSTKSMDIARPNRRKEKVKLTLKHRIRNWILDDGSERAEICVQVQDAARFSSEGMRLQVYRASGGFVVETHSYDRKKDQSSNTMHVITDEEDLGERIGKIIMMETLRA